jgi:hypothetical protein
VTDIQRDLPQLTREEIEAAIQYYLNHRDDIERDLRRGREIFTANAPAQGSIPTSAQEHDTRPRHSMCVSLASTSCKSSES